MGEGVRLGSVVYVKYRDHVLFQNTDPSLYRPAIRECVGWIIKESKEAIWVLWDRGVEPLPHERTRPEESGLVILKSEILEVKELG